MTEDEIQAGLEAANIRWRNRRFMLPRLVGGKRLARMMHHEEALPLWVARCVNLASTIDASIVEAVEHAYRAGLEDGAS